MALLMTILFAISFNLRTIMSEWELLAEQNTETGGYFGSEVKTQNIGNEGDALFSKIAGITNPSSLYQNADGKYTFRLIFTPKDGSVEQTIEWTQTSWLLDDVSPWATDVEIISAPEETSGDPGVWFRGLATTTNANCYIDGNGNGHGYWYNCVCSINAWNGGIPGYDKKTATRMRLWIEVQVVSEWELLAEQNTLTGGYFGSEVKTQNIGIEGDALFSKIAGIANPSSYQNTDGKYTFKLIFTQNNVEKIIEWTQTSWLLDDVSPWATDVEIINAPTETHGDTGTWFRGLATTTNPNCYIDGNGNGHGYWYNCVCSINPWRGGIPGYDGEMATRMRLWIQVPVVMPEYVCLTTTISGYQHLNGQYILNNNAWEDYQIIGLYESDKPDNCDDKTYRIWKWNAEYSWGVTWALGEFDYGECGINPEIVSDCNGYWVIDGTIRSEDEFQIAAGGCLYGAACSTCSV